MTLPTLTPTRKPRPPIAPNLRHSTPTWPRRLQRFPPERRLLVTDHDDLAWFAAAYDMKVVGAVTPSFSSMASISAQEMAALQE